MYIFIWHILIDIHACMHAYIHTHIHICIHLCCIWICPTYTHICPCIASYMYTYMHIYTIYTCHSHNNLVSAVQTKKPIGFLVLGLCWDTVDMSISLPSDKLLEIQHLSPFLLLRHPVIACQIMSFLGKTTFCANRHVQLCQLCYVIQINMLNGKYSSAHLLFFSPVPTALHPLQRLYQLQWIPVPLCLSAWYWGELWPDSPTYARFPIFFIQLIYVNKKLRCCHLM